MYACVLAVAPCERVYSSRSNATHIKRVLAIESTRATDARADADADVVARPLTLWNHHATVNLRPGDIIATRARPAAHRGAHRRASARACVASRGASLDVLARAEDVLGRRWGAIGGGRGCREVGTFGGGGCRVLDDAARRAVRRLARRCRDKHRELLRREVDHVETRRRESFSRFEASYEDVERVRDAGEGRVGGGARRCHFLGRVARWTARASTHGNGSGESYSRRVVWACQSAGGAMVEIYLPPTTETVEEARRLDLESAVIDVRFALVARASTLVCDSKYSFWRVLDASDPRYDEVCARVPETTFDGDFAFGDVARRMRSTGFSRESATSLISFDARVRWVDVQLGGGRRWRRVPRMLLEDDASTATEMTMFACLECLREIVPDRNGVYKPCQCASTSDDARCGFAWRDVVLGLCGPNEDDEDVVVPARASGYLVRRLLFGVDPASVLRTNEDEDEEETDEGEKDALARSRRIDHRLLVLTAINQLAAWRKNGAATRWKVKFPALDENGLARSSSLELVDFNI